MLTRELTPEEDRTRRTVIALARYRGLRGADLARATGMIPMAISTRMNGKTVIGLADLYRFAEALDVETWVLLEDEDTALRWAMDNAPSAVGQRGMVELPFVVGVLGAAVAAWLGVRSPQLAVLFDKCRESTDDPDYVKHHDRRSRTGGFRPAAVTNFTLGANSVCRSRTHLYPLPDHCLHSRHGLVGDASQRLGER